MVLEVEMDLSEDVFVEGRNEDENGGERKKEKKKWNRDRGYLYCIIPDVLHLPGSIQCLLTQKWGALGDGLNWFLFFLWLLLLLLFLLWADSRQSRRRNILLDWRLDSLSLSLSLPPHAVALSHWAPFSFTSPCRARQSEWGKSTGLKYSQLQRSSVLKASLKTINIWTFG